MVVARDGLTLGELPAGSRVGTGSPRRVAQLEALGLGLEISGIRGNVDTRIGKVRSGEHDAVLLARAGLARIGRLDEVTEVLDPLQMLPAPGQGALGIECRVDDTEFVADLARLEDAHARAAVEAERAVLATLEGGCSAPIGALAEVVEGEDGDELGQGRGPVPGRGARGAEIRDRDARRRRGGRGPAGERDARRRGSSVGPTAAGNTRQEAVNA